MNSTPNSPESTVVISSAEDLLAHIPCVLGFVPSSSVVMVACSGGSGMHARVDLPHDDDERAAVAAQLREAARSNGIESVALVLYTTDVAAARAVLGELALALLTADIRVDIALRVADDHWFLLLPEPDGPEPPGVAFDVSAHPLLARAVLAGQVTHGSREELVASVAPDPGRVAEVGALLEATPVAVPVEVEPEAAWASNVVQRHVAARTLPTGVELARLLRALRLEETQEHLVCAVTRPTARAHADLWAGLLPALPPEHVAPAAGLLALAAWVAGDGALAWCAVDRVGEAPGRSAVSDFVTAMLQKAVPPSAWGPSAA